MSSAPRRPVRARPVRSYAEFEGDRFCPAVAGRMVLERSLIPALGPVSGRALRDRRLASRSRVLSSHCSPDVCIDDERGRGSLGVGVVRFVGISK